MTQTKEIIKHKDAVIGVIKEREYGIDALRILSMFMVVVLHMLGNGGILDTAEIMSTNYLASWFLEISAFCAVNCYALISGYVGCNAKYRYSNILTLWLQVAFYTIGITLVFYFLKPEWVTFDRIKSAFFPVLSYQYWYFSAYFGLFFLIPALNIIVKKLPQKNLRAVIISVLLLCFVSLGFGTDVFAVGNGYSTIWLAVLYVLGGYLKKYETLKEIKVIYAVLIYGLCVLITWTTKVVIESDVLVNYLSPTMVLASIALFAFFAKLKPNRVACKIISKVSPLAFGVYLIHVHPFIWKVMTYKLTWILNGSCVKLIFGVLGISLLVFLICIIIDYIRVCLFNRLKIKKRLLILEDKILGDFWKI